MNSSPAGQKAAGYARDCATSQTGDYFQLSSLMCWDAVVLCAVNTGAIPTKLDITATQFSNFVQMTDPLVADPIAMRRVPQGSFLAFIENSGGSPKLIHAMMAVGQGMAAGNKNACVGIGGPVGSDLLTPT